MINDLELSAVSQATCDAQVCIVGAGLAGLFLARLLREQGVQVVMLEAGSAAARSPVEMGQSCEQRGHSYRGADVGRSFGLGGTSVLWGGQLIPMAESDFGPRPQAGFDAWPITHADVARHYGTVREHLGLGGRTAADQASTDASLLSEFPDLRRFGREFELRFSEWLPFGKRNFAASFADSLKTDASLVVWLNAAVTAMGRPPDGDSRIETLTAQSSNGRVLTVRARALAICAGALESTRLLLAFDESSNSSITRDGAPLGRYFSDHLSVTCGRIICRDRGRYDRAAAPSFARGVMRTPRLELAASAQRDLGLPSAFVHLPFVTSGDTGLDIARYLLMRHHGKRRDLRHTPGMHRRLVSDLLALTYWRLIHRRLWIPPTAERSLQLDIEQAPNPDSRLYLSAERDALNRKRLIVDWRICPSDLEALRTVAAITAAAWRRSPLGRWAEIEPSLPPDSDFLTKPYDVYHPAGSTRMGTSPRNSVVDGDLRLWGTTNCFVATTAVFPSMGSANPGLTHLALTSRLANEIARQVRP